MNWKPWIFVGVFSLVALIDSAATPTDSTPNPSILVWGDNSFGQTMVPSGLTEVVALAAGGNHTLALRENAAVISWGEGGARELPGFTNISQIAAGEHFDLGLRADGKVVAWGDNSLGQTNVPIDLNDAVAIAAGGASALALRGNGTVIGWGDNSKGQARPPEDLTNAVAIAINSLLGAALRSDGTVLLWGSQTGLVNEGENHFTQISAGGASLLLLRANRTALAIGIDIPDGLTDIVQVATGGNAAATLYSNGSVNTWGPKALGSPPASPATLVTAGNDHVAMLSKRPSILGLQDMLLPAGSHLSLSALVTGSPPFQYQWYFSRQPAGTNQTLDIKITGIYELHLFNEFGMFDTGSFTINVYNPIVILQQPSASLTVFAGEDVDFPVSVTGQSPLHFQWLLNGNTIPGANTAELKLPNVQSQTAGQYSLVITNAYESVTNLVTDLSVISTPTIISLQPRSMITNAGAALIELAVAATGADPLHYQWQFNGNGLFGQTNSLLTLTNVQAGDAGDYTVIVTSPLENARSDPARLTVIPSIPQLTVNPGGFYWPGGRVLNLNPLATGTEPISFAWFFNGELVPGAQSPTLSVPNFQAENAGLYTVLASNEVGVAEATFNVMFPAPILTLNLPEHFSAVIGGTVTYQAEILRDATTRPIYTWYFNNKIYFRGSYYTNSTLTLTNITIRDAGIYSVQVYLPGVGGASSASVLNVFPGRGHLFAWGDNSSGQTNTPQTNAPFYGVAAGRDHSLAIDSEASVVAWGNNEFGQATPPPGLRYVQAVAAGADHSLALGLDGSIVGWGRNDFGQASPPNGLSNVVAIAAGERHSVALLANGKVVAWGDSGLGQGVTPINLNNIIQIAAGAIFNLALTSGGEVYLWGDGSSTPVNTGLRNIIVIGAGWKQKLANDSDGQPAFWGNNPSWQESKYFNYPAGAALTGGVDYSVILTRNRDVRLVGMATSDELKLPRALSQVIQVAGGYRHLVALASAPVILAQPDSLIATQKANVRIAASVVDAGLASYQWLFNGAPIPGATNVVFSIANATIADSGYYSLVARYGDGPSSAATTLVRIGNQLSVLRVGGQNPTIAIGGQIESNRLYRLQSTTDLKTWIDATNIFSEQTSFQFNLLNSHPSGFYRLVSP